MYTPWCTHCTRILTTLLVVRSCSQVATAGLLNIIGAPHLSESSTYEASYNPRTQDRPLLLQERSADYVEKTSRWLESVGFPAQVSQPWARQGLLQRANSGEEVCCWKCLRDTLRTAAPLSPGHAPMACA